MRLLEKPFGLWKPLTFNSLLFKQGPCWISKPLWEGSLNGIFVFPKHLSPAVFFNFQRWGYESQWESSWQVNERVTALLLAVTCKLLIKHPWITKWRRSRDTSGDLWSSSSAHPVATGQVGLDPETTSGSCCAAAPTNQERNAEIKLKQRISPSGLCGESPSLCHDGGPKRGTDKSPGARLKKSQNWSYWDPNKP